MVLRPKRDIDVDWLGNYCRVARHISIRQKKLSIRVLGHMLETTREFDDRNCRVLDKVNLLQPASIL